MEIMKLKFHSLKKMQIGIGFKNLMLLWSNWQPRKIESLMPKGVWVRVPPVAPNLKEFKR